MKAIELAGDVDDQHCLTISVPASVMPGKVRVIVLTPAPEEDDAEGAWIYGISQEWIEELRDCVRIFTL